jgi:hypothetical protein
VVGVNPSQRTTARAYGDLSAAGSYMVTHVNVGTDEWTIAGEWLPTHDGWRFVH